MLTDRSQKTGATFSPYLTQYYTPSDVLVLSALGRGAEVWLLDKTFFDSSATRDVLLKSETCRSASVMTEYYT